MPDSINNKKCLTKVSDWKANTYCFYYFFQCKICTRQQVVKCLEIKDLICMYTTKLERTNRKVRTQFLQVLGFFRGMIYKCLNLFYYIIYTGKQVSIQVYTYLVNLVIERLFNELYVHLFLEKISFQENHSMLWPK